MKKLWNWTALWVVATLLAYAYVAMLVSIPLWLGTNDEGAAAVLLSFLVVGLLFVAYQAILWIVDRRSKKNDLVSHGPLRLRARRRGVLLLRNHRH